MSVNFKCFVDFNNNRYDICINNNSNTVSFNDIYLKIQTILDLFSDQKITFDSHLFEVFNNYYKRYLKIKDFQFKVKNEALIRVSVKTPKKFNLNSSNNNVINNSFNTNAINSNQNNTVIPIVPHISRNPIVSNVNRNPNEYNVNRNPVVTNVSRTPIESNVNRSRIEPNVSRNPIVFNNSRNPIESNVNRNPIVANVSRNPIESNVNRNPMVSNVSRNPIESNVNRNPMVSNIIRNPIESNITGNPFVSNVNRNRIESNINQIPVVSNINRNQTNFEFTPKSIQTFKVMINTIKKLSLNNCVLITDYEWNNVLPVLMVNEGFVGFEPNYWLKNFIILTDLYKLALNPSETNTDLKNFPLFDDFNTLFFSPKGYDFYRKIMELRENYRDYHRLHTNSPLCVTIDLQIKDEKFREKSSFQQNLEISFPELLRLNSILEIIKRYDEQKLVFERNTIFISIASEMQSKGYNWDHIICKNVFFNWFHYYIKSFGEFERAITFSGKVLIDIFTLFQSLYLIDLSRFIPKTSPHYKSLFDTKDKALIIMSSKDTDTRFRDRIKFNFNNKTEQRFRQRSKTPNRVESNKPKTQTRDNTNNNNKSPKSVSNTDRNKVSNNSQKNSSSTSSSKNLKNNSEYKTDSQSKNSSTDDKNKSKFQDNRHNSNDNYKRDDNRNRNKDYDRHRNEDKSRSKSKDSYESKNDNKYHQKSEKRDKSEESHRSSDRRSKSSESRDRSSKTSDNIKPNINQNQLPVVDGLKVVLSSEQHKKYGIFLKIIKELSHNNCDLVSDYEWFQVIPKLMFKKGYKDVESIHWRKVFYFFLDIYNKILDESLKYTTACGLFSLFDEYNSLYFCATNKFDSLYKKIMPLRERFRNRNASKFDSVLSRTVRMQSKDEVNGNQHFIQFQHSLLSNLDEIKVFNQMLNIIKGLEDRRVECEIQDLFEVISDKMREEKQFMSTEKCEDLFYKWFRFYLSNFENFKTIYFSNVIRYIFGLFQIIYSIDIKKFYLTNTQTYKDYMVTKTSHFVKYFSVEYKEEVKEYTKQLDNKSDNKTKDDKNDDKSGKKQINDKNIPKNDDKSGKKRLNDNDIEKNAPKSKVKKTNNNKSNVSKTKQKVSEPELICID